VKARRQKCGNFTPTGWGFFSGAIDVLFWVSLTTEHRESLLGRAKLACVLTGVINLVDWQDCWNIDAVRDGEPIKEFAIVRVKCFQTRQKGIL
jgi:hypothetical protein